MDFTQLMSMFAPQPGMDPFAAGNALATNPEQMVDQLATLGPPPPPGQPIADFFAQKTGNMPMEDQGALPPNARPTSFAAGAGSAGGYGNAANPRMGGPFPKVGQPNPDEAPTGPFSANPTQPSPLLGPTPIDAFGSVPPVPPQGPSVQGVQGTVGLTDTGDQPYMPTVEKPALGIPLPRPRPDMTAPGGGKKPEILSGGGDERSVPQGGEADPEKMKKIQAALKGMGGLLQGVKAPPAPETQKISSPSAPRPTGQMGPSALMALVQQLQGSAPVAAPLRLGNALYAGGRGIY